MNDQQVLKERLHYCGDTGTFTWRVKPCKNKRAGDVAGCMRQADYVRIRVLGRLHLAHRLAWLYVHGAWPSGEIDHIDGNPSNNRIGNLRDVSHRTNTQNVRKAFSSNRSSGLLGVCSSAGRHRALLWVGGKQKYIGAFPTAELAHQAYLNAKRVNHAGCTV